MKKPLRILGLVAALIVAFAVGVGATLGVSALHAAPHQTTKRLTSPVYTNCLWTGNSITAGTDLGAPYTSAFEGYMLNDLNAEKNASNCLPGHYHYTGQSGWCASQALANMQSTNYHPAVDFATVQFGEDEYANASGCKRTPTQYQTDLAALLAYIIANSPSLTLVCFDPWEQAGVANSLGFIPEDYGAAAEAACNASGAASVVIINLTAIYPAPHYHGGAFELNHDTYHPNTWANATIGQMIVNALP